jgi:hypothetical protein
MFPIGPSRHFAALQQLGRFLSEADINSGGSQNRICETRPRKQLAAVRDSLSLAAVFTALGGLTGIDRGGKPDVRLRIGRDLCLIPPEIV